MIQLHHVSPVSRTVELERTFLSTLIRRVYGGAVARMTGKSGDYGCLGVDDEAEVQ
jgi:hypothetical protein